MEGSKQKLYESSLMGVLKDLSMHAFNTSHDFPHFYSAVITQ